jgi:biotin carboxylase
MATDSAPAVIVDGYSTGNFLPAAFAKLGVGLVHVQSSAELMPTMLAPALAEDYRDNLVCQDVGAIASTADALAALHPVAVLAGQEPGVPLADALSERLGLATNGTTHSLARRDKYRMIETLRAAGIRCADQYKGPTPAEIAGWAARTGYPVVVKPLSSASTDNVHICRDAAETTAAAATVLGSTDIFGARNAEVLVQSFLSGTEYIVDTVSAARRRYACGVWEYEKTITPAGKRIYDRDVLLDPDADPVPELIAYVDDVLAALGIRHGPAHAEVIMTPAGPALVEIGARVNGNMNPGFHDRCLGVNQADLTALAYVRPGEFGREYAGRVYRKRRDAVVHSTATHQDGIVESIDQAAVDKIAALPTVHLVSVKLKPGSRIRPTVDLLTSPLRIFMVGDDAAALRADHQAIADLKDLVYRVAPAEPS